MEKIVRAIIAAKFDRCATRVIHRLRRISAAEWRGDDAPERTLWDFWKREMQEEHSLRHDLLENMVDCAVVEVVERLPFEDGALLTLSTVDEDEIETWSEPVLDGRAVADRVLQLVNSRASDEPHRAEVQKYLDDQARDRWERDMEPYIPLGNRKPNSQRKESDGKKEEA